MNDRNRVTRNLLVGLCLFPIVMTIGCDSLLEVEVPGLLVEDDLNDEALAETLILGVQTDFECAFGSYAWATAVIADEFWYGGATNNEVVYALRLERLTDLGQQTRATACTTIATFLPLHLARKQAVVATELIEGFEGVENPNFLLAKARVFEAYSLLLLGEAYCEMTIDGELPTLSRAQTWELAKTKFGEAASLAGNATGSDAAAIGTLALVGRARANLNLGDMAAVLSDAGSVPDDFVYYATFDATPNRRNNTLQERSIPNNGTSLSVHGSFHNLEVPYAGGVPDPRVQLVEDGIVFLGSFPMFRQLKYPDNASDIPIGTGREAQLMAAEALGGAQAVTIINNLRATVSELDWVVDTHPGLPAYAGGTSAAEILALVIEERRRELWLQGYRIGDKLRYNETWETGNDPHGRVYGPLTCIPLHEVELESL